MTIKQKVYNLIAAGKIEKAVDFLQTLDFQDQELKNQIILLSGRYNQWKRNNILGFAEQSELRKIELALVQSIEMAEVEGDTIAINQENNKNRNVIMVSIFALLFAVLLGIIYYKFPKTEIVEKAKTVEKEPIIQSAMEIHSTEVVKKETNTKEQAKPQKAAIIKKAAQKITPINLNSRQEVAKEPKLLVTTTPNLAIKEPIAEVKPQKTEYITFNLVVNSKYEDSKVVINNKNAVFTKNTTGTVRNIRIPISDEPTKIQLIKNGAILCESENLITALNQTITSECD